MARKLRPGGAGRTSVARLATCVSWVCVALLWASLPSAQAVSHSGLGLDRGADESTANRAAANLEATKNAEESTLFARTAASFLATPLSAFQVSPNSSAWLSQLSAREDYGLWVDYDAWTPAIYHATSSTPMVTISIKNSREQITIPYRSTFKPDPTSDSQLAVINDSTGCEYEFDAFDPSTMTANAEATFDLDTGSGVHAAGAGVTGSDLSMLAGLITPIEVRSGAIEHALRFDTPINSPTFVAPATRSDGGVSGGIPEGEMMRLDPSLDLSQFQLTPFQLMVATALQRYGAYDADSGSSFKITVENTIDGASYDTEISPLPWAVMSHIQFGTTSYAPGAIAPQTNRFAGCNQQQPRAKARRGRHARSAS
jgi:hypothetical protein